MKLRLPLMSLTLALGLALIQLLASLAAGSAKPATDWQWLDIVGEGSAMLLPLGWLLLVLASRPNSRVSQYLCAGIAFIFLAFFQDLLDEFIDIAHEPLLLTITEKLTAPLGMALITAGLIAWRREQLCINAQLSRRERFYREQSALDYVTRLYRADYMVAQLQDCLRDAVSNNTPATTLVIDVDDFDAINQQNGAVDANRLLRDVADVIVLNLRPTDLACRYAGDRFIALLPGADWRQASIVADDIRHAMESFRFKSLHGDTLSIRTSIGIAQAQRDETAQAWLQRANSALHRAKRNGKNNCQLAAA